MKIAIKFQLPVQQVFQSVENAILKKLSQQDDSLDLVNLKEGITQFQKNLVEQIDIHKEQPIHKRSVYKNHKQYFFQNNQNMNLNSSQFKMKRENRNNSRFPIRNQREAESDDSDSREKSNSSSQSNDQEYRNKFKYTYLNKQSVLSPEEKKFVLEFFRKHYDPNRRNKMRLVKLCSKHIKTSKSAIYSEITKLMRNQKFNGGNQHQFSSNKNDKESSDEMDEEFIKNLDLSDSDSDQKKEQVMNDNTIDQLLRKYDFKESEGSKIKKEYEDQSQSNIFRQNQY